MAPPSTPAFAAVRLFRQRLVATTLSWLALAAHVILISGCNYYRTKPQEVTPVSVTRLAESKLFLIHQGSKVWQLNNPQLKDEVLTGQKATLTPALATYPAPSPGGGSPRYKSKNKELALNLVHLYITDFQAGEGEQINIPLTAMNRLDVVEANTGKNILSHVLGATGIWAGIFTLIGVIALLTKSSCPFVYVHNGEQYQFVGEAYGGAIFAPSERDDYMPLPDIQVTEGQFQVKITNELRERQYTNVAELWVAHHADNVQVLLDKVGNAHTIARPQVPTNVVSMGGVNYTTQLAATDHKAFLFNEAAPGATQNSVVLSFANPTQSKTGKLVLHAQNSLWLDYLYGEFTKKFGDAYNKWALTQKDVPAKELNQWSLDQGIPLKISLKTANGWQLIDNIPTVGPLASRDLVIPFTLPEGLASQPVQVKVETGFMFWELDYAAVDFSPNQPVRLEKSPPETACDEIGRNQRQVLSKVDTDYLQQLHPGTEVTLTYRATPPAASQPAQHRTAFLHTRGYYEHIRQYEGIPNLPQLYAFRQPGRFIEFSKEKYQESQREMNLALVNP
ncbi:hypothetical protein SAMN00120144_1732 [Hymenobacter roseosalivarius DSM 11622]|uniref:Uncharacterized protein n=1 Tax=Hymenobacter roseosalivarius DSM 11622 TaxID=645990 RepID=A0A1W1W3U4_9BACT|nr:hypothetical protein [Hymenobacter roseosalivarius]SMC00302.1 hypothetical protein SAMN00120144_1732 [Hymenobacter roseosalivarius DSM 11622]